MPAYHRYVALGDSQTEGLNDLDGAGTPVGWADRLAREMAATTSPDLRYANLAVSGCRAHHVLSNQLPAALELEPDLATVVVGMNDVLRHDYDLDKVVGEVAQCFAALTDAGARVLTMTFPDIARMLPVMAWLRPRQMRLRTRLLGAAERHGVEVLDLFGLEMCGEASMWSHDRIHGSPTGHARIAAGMAHLLDLPGSDPAWSEPQARPPGLLEAVRRDAWWLGSFMGPFLLRQLRGKGTGADGLPKRAGLLRVEQGLLTRPVTRDGLGLRA